MKNKNLLIGLFLSIIFWNSVFPIYSQELKENELTQLSTLSSTEKGILYSLQKYTGLNYLLDLFVETAIKVVIKLKTRAKEVKVDLKLYSAWDLFKKKAKYFKIDIRDLSIQRVPIEQILLTIDDPIYFRKNRVLLPLRINTFIRVDLESVTKVLNNLPKWKEIFKKLELPLPPFGSTQISVNDINIKINDVGLIYAQGSVSSPINPDSESLRLEFTGNLALKDKKIIVSNLESEIEDIFTKDSDTGRSFSAFLEDLINPVFNFGKYERNGLVVEKVNLSFSKEDINLEIDSRLLPEGLEAQ